MLTAVRPAPSLEFQAIPSAQQGRMASHTKPKPAVLKPAAPKPAAAMAAALKPIAPAPAMSSAPGEHILMGSDDFAADPATVARTQGDTVVLRNPIRRTGAQLTFYDEGYLKVTALA